MTSANKLTKAQQFFFDHCGYSYDSAKESPVRGRRRCAKALAKAETWAKDVGARFSWRFDEDATSADWSNYDPPYRTWLCVLWMPGDTDEQGQRAAASLGGVDFGPEGEPHDSPYARVVEAELALEVMIDSEAE